MYCTKMILVLVLGSYISECLSAETDGHVGPKPDLVNDNKKEFDEMKNRILGTLVHDLNLKTQFEKALKEEQFNSDMNTNECNSEKTSIITDILLEMDSILSLKAAFVEHFQSDKNRIQSICSATEFTCQGEMDLKLHSIHVQERRVAQLSARFHELPVDCPE